MKKTVLNLVLLVLTSTLFAQSQAGKITYFFNRSVDVDLGDNMPEEQKTAMKEMISKQFKKTFELEFSGAESVYSEKAELQKETNSNVRIMIVGGPTGKLYKSTKDKKFIRSDESLGKRFLITDELEKPEWELVDSTKLIKKYLCYKAKYVREINRNDSIVKIPVTAWYAPDIPLNTGPEKFWGLPGLILEIQQGKVSITCTKIEFQKPGDVVIKKPKNGKKVSEKEFEKIMTQKVKQMQEMDEGGRQKEDGNRIEIKIGG